MTLHYIYYIKQMNQRLSGMKINVCLFVCIIIMHCASYHSLLHVALHNLVLFSISAVLLLYYQFPNEPIYMYIQILLLLLFLYDTPVS